MQYMLGNITHAAMLLLHQNSETGRKGQQHKRLRQGKGWALTLMRCSSARRAASASARCLASTSSCILRTAADTYTASSILHNIFIVKT